VSTLPPHREIYQTSRLDQLWTALKFLAWAITTAVWIGIAWFALTEGRQLIEYWSWK